MSMKRRTFKPTRRMSVKDLPITRLELVESLYDNNFDKFFIEYNGYFSNKIIQASIALFHIGVSKEKFLGFMEHYISQLESINGPTRRRQDKDYRFGEIPLEELKGSRRGYYKIRKHYHVILGSQYEDMICGMVRNELPSLALGLPASSHCLEIIGYAMSIQSAELTCDGLAYLYHSYNPIVIKNERDPTKFGHGSYEFLDLVKKLGEDAELGSFIMRRRHSSGDILRQTKLDIHHTDLSLLLQNRGDALMEYVYKLKIAPEHAGFPEDCLHFLIDQFIVVYHGVETRFNLHLLDTISSAWALSQIMPVLGNADFKFELVRLVLCSFFAVYLTQGRPPFSESNLRETSVLGMDWDRILENVLALPVSIDENIYKLAQVCYHRSLKNKDLDMSDVYKRAVVTTMGADLSHHAISKRRHSRQC